MKKAYIFDLDGTLIDSMPTVVKVLTNFLDERSVKYPKNLVKEVIALGYVGTAEYFVEKFPLKETAKEVYEILVAQIVESYEKTIPEKENVGDILRALKEQGARLNVLTASPHVFLDPCIKRLGWTELFENAWTVEDFSTAKADPEIYRKAAARLRLSHDECVMVDDSVAALNAAHRAGLYCVGCYDEISAAYADEMKTFAHQYIYNFKELL